MVVDRKLSEAELFQVVGAGWKQQESEKRKKTFQEKLKGKPVFSAFLLFLIVLAVYLQMLWQIMIPQVFISRI